MHHWPDTRILDLLGLTQPIIQAPMAGAAGVELAIAVALAGGLGSLPCAMLTAVQVEGQVAAFRSAVSAPVNLNFFCHSPPEPDAGRDERWRRRLQPYYAEHGIPLDAKLPSASRAPFDAAMCALVESLEPEVVSFHFGLPSADLLRRVKATGAKVIASATTVREGLWLEAQGCDAIIAMGSEAGGHRGMFLTTDVATQVGTFALVPQMVDAVRLPVIAAGGIADGRGMASAIMLGASAVQVGTAYLLTPEARISEVHRAALRRAQGEDTAITNLFTGRPARGIVNRVMRELGPMSDQVPAFPTAGAALAPLRAHDEQAGTADFTNLWAGQGVGLVQEEPAERVTERLAAGALAALTATGRRCLLSA